MMAMTRYSVIPWLRGNWALLLAVSAIPAVLCLLWLVLRGPLYQSSLMLSVDVYGVTGETPVAPEEGRVEIATVARLLHSSRLAERIVDELSLDGSALGSRLEVQTLPGTRLLEVRYVDQDPVRVGDVLDSLAVHYLDMLDELHQQQIRQETDSVLKKLDELLARPSSEASALAPTDFPGRDSRLFFPVSNTGGRTDIPDMLEYALVEGLVEDFRQAASRHARVHVLETASTPVNLRSGISPAPPLLVWLLALGIAGSLLYSRHRWRNTASFPDELQHRFNKPVALTLPLLEDNFGKSGWNALQSSGDSTMAEALRNLRTDMQLRCGSSVRLQGLSVPERRGRRVLVSSAERGAGKSMLAVNLALTLGQVERVLLINADLRGGQSGSSYCGIPAGSPGLSHLIAGAAPLRRCLYQMDKKGIDVLPAGVVPPNPQELLSSRRFSRIMQMLSRRYDFVIVDGPCIEHTGDALLLAPHCSETLFVFRADDSSLSAAKSALRRLHRVSGQGEESCALVMNAVDRDKARRYGYQKQFPDQNDGISYAYRQPGGHYLADY